MFKKSLHAWEVAFLINLDERTDRWSTFLDNSPKLDFPVVRYSAISSKSIKSSQLRIPAPVAACWKSHQGVAEAFLKTGAEHCLILEDDVELSNSAISGLNKLWRKNLGSIDLLQIGFCVHNNKLANRTDYRVQKMLLKMVCVSNLIRLRLAQLFLRFLFGYNFSYLSQLAQPVAINAFELGTHAYVVSRSFAEIMLQFNNPVHVPADLALIELAHSGKYRGYRLITSLVNQSDSASSIGGASNSPMDKELDWLGESRAG